MLPPFSTTTSKRNDSREFAQRQTSPLVCECPDSSLRRPRRTALRCSPPVFFRLSTWELWLIIASVVLGFVAVGYLIGRVLRQQVETLREPVGIVQGAFFALVGLILAFGLTLAIGRYDARRVGRRRRRQHDRDHVPARTDAGRADAKPVAPTAQAVHGRQPGAFARGSHDPRVRTRDRRGRRSPAAALDSGRGRAHSRATR